MIVATPAVMFQGTGSHVGKSTIVAGLARLLTRRGLAVRPFKPLNMSNNAAVTADGGEIGRAQALQARAAGIAPTVDMNPVLVKPQAGGAQLVVRGQRMDGGDAADSEACKRSLMPEVLDSYARTAAGADIVLVEGAGSPAELNLRQGDIVNMGFALAADVPVILIGDIDRGGVIASLVGTLTVLAAPDRAHVRAFLVNKLHGDAERFAGGVREIVERTDLACLGVVPHTAAVQYLPAEDAVALDVRSQQSGASIRVAVLQLSFIANFDDLDPLIAEPDVDVIRVPPGSAIPGDVDLVILPGTKATLADLAFIRDQGWDIDLIAHWRRGGHIFGICGGYQLLGNRIADSAGIEGQPGDAAELGLLDVTTELEPAKRLDRVSGHDVASGAAVAGYEMHLGVTTGPDCARPMLMLGGGDAGATTPCARVQGCYLHGLFAADEFRHVFLNRLKSRFRKSCGSDQSAEEEHDGGGVEEGAGRGDGGLEVLCQSPVAVDPGEEALHDPAARLDGEADLIGAFAHDLDGDHGGRGDLLAGVAAVGKDLLDERKRAA